MNISMDNDVFLSAQKRKRKSGILILTGILALAALGTALFWMWDVRAERTGFFYPAPALSDAPGGVPESAMAGLRVPVSFPDGGCTALFPGKTTALDGGGAFLQTFEGDFLAYWSREGSGDALIRYAGLLGVTPGEGVFSAEAEGWFGSRAARCRYETVRATDRKGKGLTLRCVTYEVRLSDGVLTVFGATRGRGVRDLCAQVTVILSTIHEKMEDSFTEVPLSQVSASSEEGRGDEGAAPADAAEGGEENAPMDEEFSEAGGQANPNGIHVLPEGELLKKSGEAFLTLPEWDGRVAFSFYHVGGGRLYEITLTGPDGAERGPDQVTEEDGFEYAFFVDEPVSGEWKFFFRGEGRIGTYSATWIPAEAFVPVAERGRKGAENE